MILCATGGRRWFCVEEQERSLRIVLALGSNAAEVHEVVKGGEGADGIATPTIHRRFAVCQEV